MCLCSRMSKSVEQIIRNWQSLEDYLECTLSSKYFEVAPNDRKEKRTSILLCVNMSGSWIMKWQRKSVDGKKVLSFLPACPPAGAAMCWQFIENGNKGCVYCPNWHNYPCWPEIKPFDSHNLFDRNQKPIYSQYTQRERESGARRTK